LKKRFKDDSSDGPLGNAFAALAAIFQNREADLAWPERSKGTWVPALKKPLLRSLHLKLKTENLKLI
jgi:hypothetical protein